IVGATGFEPSQHPALPALISAALLRASVGSTEVTICPHTWTLTTPCARASRRYAEPKNFPIGIAHPWSWAIGSSTSAAQRSFDGVVSRRYARPFASSAELGLQQNGRPSPRGTALWTGSCSMG